MRRPGLARPTQEERSLGDHLAFSGRGTRKEGVERVPVRAAGPLSIAVWYATRMSGTYAVVVGDRGRLVIPSEVREAAGIEEGTRLMLLPTESGLVLMTREQLRERVREDLNGLDLVAALLADRRKASAEEDAA